MTWMLLLAYGCSGDSDGSGEPPAPPPTDEPVWSFGRTPIVNTQLLGLVLPLAAEVAVRCEAVSDPDEVLLASSETADRWHELLIAGLLADTDYRCTWTAGEWSGAADVRTDPVPDWAAPFSVEGTPEWGQWTLWSTGRTSGPRNQQVLVVDGAGRLRWIHRLVEDHVPDVDASYIGGGEVLLGGGYGVNPKVVDLAGTVLRRVPASTTGLAFHHHAELTPSGQVLALSLVNHLTDDEAYDWLGFTVELHDPSLQTSTWALSSQRGLDDGWLTVPPEVVNDPYHPNSVQLVDDKVYLNARNLHRIFKLDASSGELEWELGVDGDFTLWDSDGTELRQAADWFYGAHAPELDGDRLLLHDNGWARPGKEPPWSRVLELVLDERARTATVAWQWTEDGWYEPIWGDVDRLPSGGVLVTRAHCSSQAGCDPEDRTEVIELGAAEPREPVWRLTMGDEGNGGYRAQRLDGCEMFDHPTLCAPGG